MDGKKHSLNNYGADNYPNPLNVTLTIEQLTEGNHTLKITSASKRFAFYSKMTSLMMVPPPSSPYDAMGTAYSTEVINSFETTFMVDTTPPNVTINSPLNLAYQPTDTIALNCTVNEPTNQLTYCLDEKANMTMTENMTLTDLPIGQHNITVYAADEAGNIGASKMTYFSIAMPEQEPFPTTLVVAILATVSFMGVCLLVYLKRKH